MSDTLFDTMAGKYDLSIVDGKPKREGITLDKLLMPVEADADYPERTDLVKVSFHCHILRREWAAFKEWASKQLEKTNRIPCTWDRFEFSISPSSVGEYVKVKDRITQEWYEVTNPENF